MTCKIIASEGALFALWGKPTFGDIDDVLGRMESAARAAGGKIVYVTRVPVDAPPPEADVRQRLNESMPAMRAVCASYHVILEGDGFLSAVKRAILAGLMQLGWPRNTFFVHASTKEVVLKAPREARAALEKILDLAERQGLLSGPAPAELPPAPLDQATGA
jgi:hypothetical protein